MSDFKDTGGDAFPNDFIDPANRGMTLRDWFAGKALNGVISVHYEAEQGYDSIKYCAETAYKFADQILQARKS